MLPLLSLLKTTLVTLGLEAFPLLSLFFQHYFSGCTFISKYSDLRLSGAARSSGWRCVFSYPAHKLHACFLITPISTLI